MTNICDERHFELTVNGERRQVVDVYPGESLLTCFETGSASLVRKVRAKRVSGSCSVLLDGNLVCSCLVLARPQPSRRL